MPASTAWQRQLPLGMGSDLAPEVHTKSQPKIGKRTRENEHWSK
jgi:hypothetical protein